MRVLFITSLPVEGPSSRFRVYQYLPYLRQHGVEVTVRPFVSSRSTPVLYEENRIWTKTAVAAWATGKRFMDLIRARRYDLVYILREAFPFGPPIIEHGFMAATQRMIFDFDDAIYLPSIAYNNPFDRLRSWDKPSQLIRMATHVVVGSDYLRQYALRYTTSASHVTVIPTVVDTGIYCPSTQYVNKNGVTIGWIGTPRGSGYLKALLPVIEALAGLRPNITFKFVGAQPFDVGSLPVTFKQWTLKDEVADIQTFDIGIMPLTDDEETRGKCGFKLIQYMSTGIPSVCSPIGANRSLIEEGRTGFFASTLEEWRARLELLIGDRELRQGLGSAARDVAVSCYSLHAMAPRLLGVLHGAMACDPWHPLR